MICAFRSLLTWIDCFIGKKGEKMNSRRWIKMQPDRQKMMAPAQLKENFMAWEENAVLGRSKMTTPVQHTSKTAAWTEQVMLWLSKMIAPKRRCYGNRSTQSFDRERIDFWDSKRHIKMGRPSKRIWRPDFIYKNSRTSRTTQEESEVRPREELKRRTRTQQEFSPFLFFFFVRI